MKCNWNRIEVTTHSLAKTEIAAHVLAIEDAAIANGFRCVHLVLAARTKCVISAMMVLRYRIIIARFATIVVRVQIDFVVDVALIEMRYFDERFCEREFRLVESQK